MDKLRNAIENGVVKTWEVLAGILLVAILTWCLTFGRHMTTSDVVGWYSNTETAASFMGIVIFMSVAAIARVWGLPKGLDAPATGWECFSAISLCLLAIMTSFTHETVAGTLNRPAWFHALCLLAVGILVTIKRFWRPEAEVETVTA